MGVVAWGCCLGMGEPVGIQSAGLLPLLVTPSPTASVGYACQVPRGLAELSTGHGVAARILGVQEGAWLHLVPVHVGVKRGAAFVPVRPAREGDDARDLELGRACLNVIGQYTGEACFGLPRPKNEERLAF